MRWALPLLFVASMANAQALSTSIRSGGLSPQRFPSAASDSALLRFLPSVSAGEECTGSALTGTKGQALTFTRGSSAYCTKSDGTMVLLADNQPRLTSYGLMREGAATNLTIRSEEFNSGWTCTNVTVTANSTAAPDGVTDGDTLSTAVAGSYCESTAFTITGANAAASLYVRTTAGTQGGAYVLRDTTAGADRCTGTFTATTTWARRTDCTSAAITTTNTHVLRVYPGGVAGTGTLVAWGAQTEAVAAHASSYIATAGTSATRSIETSIALPTPSGLSLTEGCTRVTYTQGFGGAMGATDYILNPAAADGFRVPYFSSVSMATYDGVHVVGVTKSPVAGDTYDVLTTWTAAGNQLRLKVTGVAAATSAFTTMGATGASMALLNISGAGAWPAYLRGVVVGSNIAGCGVDP